MVPRVDQFSGCLIGQCLGDALGFVVEGFSPEACKRYVEDFLKTGWTIDFGHFPFPFGQYSDDSQLARELLQSYVACKTFDASDYAERIKLIFAEKRIVGAEVTSPWAIGLVDRSIDGSVESVNAPVHQAIHPSIQIFKDSSPRLLQQLTAFSARECC